MSSWHALLDGDRRQRAVAALEQLRGALLAPVELPAHEQAMLTHGLPGLALTQAYVGLALEDDELVEASGTTLERALSLIPALGGALGLGRGLAGHGFVLECLSRLDIVDGDIGPVIDDALAAALDRRDPLAAHFDLMLGLAGWLVYALERPAQSRARALVPRIRDELVAMALVTEPGCAWRTPADPRWLKAGTIARHPEGLIDLGAARGLVGTAAALAASLRVGEDLDARRVASGALAFASAQRAAHGVVTDYADNDEPSAQGWCRGDPGASACSVLAYRALGDDEGAALALAATRDAGRSIDLSHGVGMCDGTAGTAHTLNRLHQLTGDRELGDAAVRALDVTIELSVKLTDQPIGVFFGLSGAALAIAAGISAHPPDWDRMLLPR